MPSTSPTAASHNPVRCPACGVPLRLRETRMVGATFPCPECRESLVLMSAADGIELQRAAVLTTPTASRLLGSSRGAWKWQLPALSPLVFAWSLAGIMAVVLIGAVIRDRLAAARPIRRVAVDAVPAVEKSSPNEQVESAASPPNEVANTEPPAAVVSETATSEPPQPAPLPTVVHGESPQPPVSATGTVAVAPVAVARPTPQVLLAQRLISFRQPKPVPRRDLLQTVEDLLDRPVRVADDVPPEVAARLDFEITVALENATVAEVLRTILRDTGLEYECTADDVKLHIVK